MKLKVLFLFIVIITIFSVSPIYVRIPTISLPFNFKKNDSPKNIIGNSKIRWSKGWEKLESGNFWSKDVIYRGKLSGSEFNLKFTDARRIKFYLETSNKDPIVGLEVWLDSKHFEFAHPDLGIEQTTIELNESERNMIHEIRGRFYCFTIPTTLCDLRIKSIEIDNSAKLLSLGKSIRKTLAILGDSISGVWGNKNYTYKLSDMIGYHLINASYNGSTMSEDEATFSGLLRIKEEIIAFKPDLLLVFLGTNDLGHKIPLSSFSRDYEKTANILKKELPKTKVVLLGLLPRADYSQEEIASFSAVIKNIAFEYNLYYADAYNWWQKEDLLDGIHPSVDAQAKLTELIYNYLKDNNLLDQKIR